MRTVGPGLHLSMPQALLLALHLRDAARLRPPASAEVPELPPLDPPARPLTAGPIAGAEAAAQQWARWWAGAFPGGPDALTSLLPPSYPGLRGMPELRGIAELDTEEAVAWAERARRREARVLAETPTALFETTLLRSVEREVGRRARPFALEVVVLPVRGAGAWETPGGPVISLALRADRDAYLAWLREQLVRVVRRDAARAGGAVRGEVRGDEEGPAPTRGTGPVPG